MSHQLLRRRLVQPSPPSPQAESVVLAGPDLHAATGATTVTASPERRADEQASTSKARKCDMGDKSCDRKSVSSAIDHGAAHMQLDGVMAAHAVDEKEHICATTSAADAECNSSLSFTEVNNTINTTNNEDKSNTMHGAEEGGGNGVADDSAVSGTSQVARSAVMAVTEATASAATMDKAYTRRCGTKRSTPRASEPVVLHDHTSASRMASQSGPHSGERHVSMAAIEAAHERTNDGSPVIHATTYDGDDDDDEVAAKLRAVASATAALLQEERCSSRGVVGASQVRRRLLSPSPPSTPASWVDTAHSSAMRASDSVRPRPAIRLLRPPSPSPSQPRHGGAGITNRPRSASHEVCTGQIRDVTAALQVGVGGREDSTAPATLFSTIYGLSTPLPPLEARVLASGSERVSAGQARRERQGWSCGGEVDSLLRTYTGLRGHSRDKDVERSSGGGAKMLAATTTIASPSPAPPHSESGDDKESAYSSSHGEDDESSPNLNRLSAASEAVPAASVPDVAQTRFGYEVEAISRLSTALSATRAANTELEKRLKTAEVLRRADAARLRQREQECVELRRRCAEVETALEQSRRSEMSYAQRVQSLTAALEAVSRPQRSPSRVGHEDKAQQTETTGNDAWHEEEDNNYGDDHTHRTQGTIGVPQRALAVELAQLKAVAAEQAAVLDRLGLRAPYTEELIGTAVRRLRRLRRHIVSHTTAPPGATLSAALLSSQSRTSDGVTTMSVDEQSHGENSFVAATAAAAGQPGLRQALGSLAERLNRPAVAKNMLFAVHDDIAVPLAMVSLEEHMKCKENA